jgi:hypothetical protein
MEFRIARAARVTGEMLERLVREKLQQDNIPEPDAVICYGAGYAGTKRALNARCSAGDKMEQGVILRRELGLEALNVQPIAGIIQTAMASNTRTFPVPLIARRRKHAQGRDIRVCKTLKGLQAAARNHGFITPFVESDTEYRVWIYRNRILAVYEKRLTEPEKNTGFGRNRSKGWTFHSLSTSDIPESLRRVCRAAIAALGLDFGAVDVLGKRNADGSTTCCVLEVNSAPGVSDEHRTAIVKLVKRVVRWCANGCPARGGIEE